MKWLALISITLVIVVSGCIQQSTCIKPFIEDTTKEYCVSRGPGGALEETTKCCCLDRNENGICDDNEANVMSAESIFQSLQKTYEDISSCMKYDYECIEKVAIRTNKYELCGNISSLAKDRINNCYRTIAINTNNLSLCEKVVYKNLTDYDSNYCKAMITKDIYYCELVSYEGAKKRCKWDLRMDVAAKTKNSSICEEFTEYVSLKDDCYSKVALYSNDVNLCEKIPSDSWSHTECIAMIEEDPSVCESLEDVVPVDNCLHKVAVVKQDVSICDKIERSWIKQDCVEDIFFYNKFYIGSWRIENYR